MFFAVASSRTPELDKRVVHVAEKYFDLDEKVQVFIDDARHYVRNCNEKYDITSNTDGEQGQRSKV